MEGGEWGEGEEWRVWGVGGGVGSEWGGGGVEGVGREWRGGGVEGVGSEWGGGGVEGVGREWRGGGVEGVGSEWGGGGVQGVGSGGRGRSGGCGEWGEGEECRVWDCEWGGGGVEGVGSVWEEVVEIGVTLQLLGDCNLRDREVLRKNE